MGTFYGNGIWNWFCLIPLLVMLGFMVVMFIMARRCMSGMGAWGPGGKTSGGVKMENQSTGTGKGIQGSMMRSCMEMMSRRMSGATHDSGMQGAFEHWSQDLERKILDLLDRKASAGPAEIAATLGVPEDAAVSLIHRLALKGKIRIGSVEKAK
jgi:hypothetical protein